MSAGPKTVGTMVIDGLLQGKMPPQPDVERRMREWAAHARTLGLVFDVQIDGGQFNILPDNRPIPSNPLGAEPASVLADGLEQLLKIFTPQQRMGLTSTLRSLEYQNGVEIQTLYAVGTDGAIQTHQRTVKAATAEAPRPLTLKEKLRLVGIGLLVAGAALAISSIFVDYRGLFRSVWERATPTNPKEVAVEAGPFGEFIEVRDVSLSDDKKSLVLTVARTDKFPLKDEDCDASLTQAKTLSMRLTIEALARGYIRCELFDTSGQFINHGELRISPLRQEEKTKLTIPIPIDRHVGKIVLGH